MRSLTNKQQIFCCQEGYCVLFNHFSMLVFIHSKGLWSAFICLILTGISLTAYAQSCSLSINHVTVSSCYFVNGMSRATVSAEIAWSNAQANDIIIVTTGTQSRTVTPGTIQVLYGNNGTTYPSGYQSIVSPQIIAFEIDANSASGVLTASFANASGCTATASYQAPQACQPVLCQTDGLGGRVFNDYNADGVLDPGETNGVAGLSITIFPCTGPPLTTTSDAFGNWQITSALTYPVRVEFTNIPATYLGSSTLQGRNSRTTVQFVEASRCDINLGVNDPLDYCQTNPLVVTPCYVNGDPLVMGTAATDPAFVGFPYASSGGSSGKTFMLPASMVGSLWAMAYSRSTKRLFSAATLKRHAGLGPGGLDAIYITDLTNPTGPPVPTFFNIGPLGINVGTVPTNSVRKLPADKRLSSTDSLVFSLIGKVGIGGMSLSSDGRTLYFINIYDNSLYALDLTTYNTSLDAKDIIKKGGPYLIPSLGCSNGVQRSWAVKYYKGKVYVGTVCDGSSGTKSDMRAGVFAFNETTNSFSTQPVFDFPLTYSKGFPHLGRPDVNGWYPWTDRFSDLFDDGAMNIARPQPIFSDIEFDSDGSMILAFNDRTGLQTGHKNVDTNGNGSYDGLVGGDILRAYANNGAFVLENAAKAGPAVGYSPTNNQGPGFGEFYNDDSGENRSNQLYHTEDGFGSLALRPGAGEVLSGAMDPLGVNTPYSFTAYSGGVRHMNNATGQVNDAYLVYKSIPDINDGSFGKSTGLGDMDLTCDLIQYIEIGNRVWLDTYKDGIQDACEKPLAGVNVSLYRSGRLIATTTTDDKGEYYFSAKSNLLNGLWSGTNADTMLRPYTAYQLQFGTGGQFTNDTFTVNNGRYRLTVANSSALTANDLNDSDAQVSTVAGTQAPTINLTTDAVGVVNHTFDVGVFCLTTAGIISHAVAICQGNTVLNNGQITITAIQNADRAFLITTSSVPSYTTAGSQPVLAGTVSFTGLSNPSSTSGTSYSVVLYNGPCCYTVLSTVLPQTVCALAGLGDYTFIDINRNGIQDAGDKPLPGVTVTLYTNGVVSSTTVTDADGLYSFTGLTPGTSYSYSVGFAKPAGYTATSANQGNDDANDSDADPLTGLTQSITLANGAFNPTIDAGFYQLPPKLIINKYVDKTKASKGETISYTLVLTNLGASLATDVVVRDSASTGLIYLAGSATVPTGTTYTPGMPISFWTIGNLSPGQSLSLTVQARIDSTGILYNKASIPGDTAIVCTSIPVKVCQGISYLFRLTAAPGRNHYRWFRDGKELTDQITNVLDVTAPGSYSLASDKVSGQCPDFSCCPFIVEQDMLPVIKVTATPATCLGNRPQADGRITLSGFTTGNTYQYSLGDSFNATASLSGDAKPIPINGLIANNLANPSTAQAYTIRVYNQAGCFTDQTVLLMPASCSCPANVCIPFVIQQTRRGKRVGD